MKSHVRVEILKIPIIIMKTLYIHCDSLPWLLPISGLIAQSSCLDFWWSDARGRLRIRLVFSQWWKEKNLKNFIRGSVSSGPLKSFVRDGGPLLCLPRLYTLNTLNCSLSGSLLSLLLELERENTVTSVCLPINLCGCLPTWQALRLHSSLRQAGRKFADSALRRTHYKW